MADANATPQLKRKGEEVAAQRKTKKQRKSDAAALRNGNGVETAITATNTTPNAKNTSTPKKQSQVTPQTNGTPSTSQQNGLVDLADQQDATPHLLKASGDEESRKTKKKEKKERKERDKQKRNNELSIEESIAATKGKDNWVTSPVQGGWFQSTDPVFSPDEKYLILANLRSLRIYATETSLLAKTLPVDEGVLTAYALSSKPSQVYIADSAGCIALWDWVSGKNLARWYLRSTVEHMAVITKPDSDDELLCCVDGKDISVRALSIKAKPDEPRHSLKQILETGFTIRGLQVLLQGKYIIVSSDESITVGKRVKVSKTELQDFEYVWREFKFSKRVTTFNAYHREPQETGKGKKVDQRDVIDIAVGDDTGVILLFEDILASFATVEKSKKDKVNNAEGLRPKRLHWHRDAVGAVKWSLDGNYVVSGGNESVLTIWQLATGQPQHLPHLSAAIENVVVSPTGSAYALTLANNSVIVVSTTELEAKTNIVGIQSRRIDYEQMPKESGRAYLAIFGPLPFAVNPKKPSEVLFSVPSSQPRQKKALQPEPYLQTYDLANQRPQARQALTRNNATEPNVAPNGGQIKEPNVTHVQMSHDGNWLATGKNSDARTACETYTDFVHQLLVDEWVPPRSDTGYLNEGIPEYNEQERLLRREIYLKIWRRDKDMQWKLEARIDAPHFFENVCGNGRVFDLVADPTALGFATVGEDHVVRIWRPKTRTRDGVIVRGAQLEGLVTWSLDASVEISDKLDVTEGSQASLPPRTSRLAFSADGSVLAVSISWDSENAGVTHLIDTHTGTIRRSLTEIDVTALSGLGFVGQCLVIVADAITVWDMVSDQLAYSIAIHTTGIGRLERVPLVRLATNETDGTFAVALPQFMKIESSSKVKKASSKISIYSPNSHKSLWAGTCDFITLALASKKSERGYIALDSRSCLQTFSPSAGPLQLLTPPPEKVERITYGEVGEGEEAEEQRPLANFLISEDLTQDLDSDEYVFNMQDLQNVLNDGSVPPPPQGLFDNILALVGGRQQKMAT